MVCCGFLYADTSNTESFIDSKQDPWILHGKLEVFNKTAFKIKQILPNNSYGYVLGSLSAGYQWKKFSVMLGGVAAGLSYDSTPDNRAIGHVGNYPGWNVLDGKSSVSNAFIHDANIHYRDIVGSGYQLDVKVGRFQQEGDDWFDSYAEGVNAIMDFNNYHIKLFGTTTVALVGSGWVNDFTNVYSTYGILNAEFGYRLDYNNYLLNMKAYVYYGAKEYVAPGGNITLSFINDNDITYTTSLIALFPIHSASIRDLNRYFFSAFKDPVGFTSTLFVRQDIDFFNFYKVSLALYKNIGNANARMGLFGNPIGIDIWDNSIYSTGNALNASVAPDAFSVLLFNTITTEKCFQYCSASLDLRYTTAPSADEYSLKLTYDLQIRRELSLKLIANYYTHVMKMDGWDESGEVKGRHVLDRSYLMSQITYEF